jgi:hypothetical protein
VTHHDALMAAHACNDVRPAEVGGRAHTDWGDDRGARPRTFESLCSAVDGNDRHSFHRDQSARAWLARFAVESKNACGTLSLPHLRGRSICRVEQTDALPTGRALARTECTEELQ